MKLNFEHNRYYSFLQILIILFFVTISCSPDKYVEQPAPTITSFTPNHSVVGAKVVITGTNFSVSLVNNVVRFNGVPAVITKSSITEITTSVPVGATTGKISITVYSHTAVSTSDYIVDTPPTPGIANCLLLKYTRSSSEFGDETRNDTIATTFTYNDQKQLTSYERGDEIVTYTYNAGLVNTVTNSSTTAVETWTYNTKKLLIKVDGTFSNSSNSDYVVDITYDDYDKVSSVKRTGGDMTNSLTSFTYTDYNITESSSVDQDSNEELWHSTLSNYDSNNNPFLILARATGNQQFFFSDLTNYSNYSKNNAKIFSDSDLGIGSNVYVYDTNSNPTKMTETFKAGGKDVFTFEYECD